MIDRIILISFCLLFKSCEKDDAYTDIRLDKELITQLKSRALDTLVLGSGSYVLDAYIWRDFQPISPPNGKPMFSINWLINIDSVRIPANIDLIKQYVIYNDSIWISDYDKKSRPYQPEYKIEKISIEGPKRGPKIFVDVISQIHDSDTKENYYLEH